MAVASIESDAASLVGFVDAIFREYHPWLCRWVTRYTGDPNLAEDVAAQAFSELLLGNPVRIEHPRAFLATIARRQIHNRRRRDGIERRYLEDLKYAPPSCTPSSEDQLIASDTIALVLRALDGVSPNTRSAFVHSQIDGVTYAEIARMLGVSTSRVQQYVAAGFRACARIADL